MHKSVEDFSVKTIQIAGFCAALQALRLPFSKEMRSEAHHEFTKWNDKSFTNNASVDINDDDMRLLSTLVKRGDEHAKVLRGVMVWCEIHAPRYWWQEMSTYRVGADGLSSESTMHTIGKDGVSIDNFDVPEDVRYMIKGKEKVVDKHPLFFGEPPKIESRILTLFGRKFEIWNNGEIYSLPYDVYDSSGRKRHFEKMKISVGGTRNYQGYYTVRLGGKAGRQMLVHRLMAMAFVDNPNNYPIVNHKDGNKWNCSVENLEWCSASENCQHAIDTGLNDMTDIHRRYLDYKKSLRWTDEIVEAWGELRRAGKTCKEIAQMYGAREAIVSSYTATKTGRYAHMSPDSLLFSLAKTYEDAIDTINEYATLYRETKDFDYVIRIKELLPETFMQRRVWMFSYQTLRRIYRQRKEHRLPQWRMFCRWIESLPFAKELITQ